ncbi:MAG: hypothetical protein Q7K26_00805 [bacterium]|nr:hypothetical protein [bacterium]
MCIKRIRNRDFSMMVDNIAFGIVLVGITLFIVGAGEFVENALLVFGGLCVALFGVCIHILVKRLIYGRTFEEEFATCAHLVGITSTLPSIFIDNGFWFNLLSMGAVWTIWGGVVFSTISLERLGNRLEEKFIAWHTRHN